MSLLPMRRMTNSSSSFTAKLLLQITHRQRDTRSMAMRGSVRSTVPTGFRNLLESLTVEILRSNPPDIYKFAADYFRAKLDARQGK